ncbi:MAG: hypothetical protein LC777_15280, partial [Actinobacteria bacterium]|nr:hypothetical protein [Actinomycetota bacterium]
AVYNFPFETEGRPPSARGAASRATTAPALHDIKRAALMLPSVLFLGCGLCSGGEASGASSTVWSV